MRLGSETTLQLHLASLETFSSVKIHSVLSERLTLNPTKVTKLRNSIRIICELTVFANKYYKFILRFSMLTTSL